MGCVSSQMNAQKPSHSMTRARSTFPPAIPPPARGSPFSTIGLALRMMPVGAIVFGVLIFSQSDPLPEEVPIGGYSQVDPVPEGRGDFAPAAPRAGQAQGRVFPTKAAAGRSTRETTVPGAPRAATTGNAPAALGQQPAGRLDPRRQATPDALSAHAQPQDQAEEALAAGMQAVPNRSAREGIEENQGAGSGVTDTSAPPVPPTSSNPGVEYGVEVASLRLTAGGTALDFRYKVVDPDKAAVVGREGGPSYLLTQDGRRISPRNVQQIGDYYFARHLDQAGRTYSTWFANQGGALQTGDLVSVVIGDLHIANIRVE